MHLLQEKKKEKKHFCGNEKKSLISLILPAPTAGQDSTEDLISVTSLEHHTGDNFTVSFSFEDSLFDS